MSPICVAVATARRSMRRELGETAVNFRRDFLVARQDAVAHGEHLELIDGRARALDLSVGREDAVVERLAVEIAGGRGDDGSDRAGVPVNHIDAVLEGRPRRGVIERDRYSRLAAARAEDRILRERDLRSVSHQDESSTRRFMKAPRRTPRSTGREIRPVCFTVGANPERSTAIAAAASTANAGDAGAETTASAAAAPPFQCLTPVQLSRSRRQGCSVG